MKKEEITNDTTEIEENHKNINTYMPTKWTTQKNWL